jgi:pyruvate/2-oxoglutarate dehydrogenase complex dihydrolipoamide dehydrogenase (E3) component
MTESQARFFVAPQDEHNQKLLSNVHPVYWSEPKPERMYNLVVIGAGTAGLISALGCAVLGGKVALVERHLMGGDCLNVGCVPSKCLIRSARAAAEISSCNRLGLTSQEVSTSSFPSVMERVRRLRAEISKNDSAERYGQMGVHVFFGEASFADPRSITVNGLKLNFRKAVIATGTSPTLPDISELEEAGFLTNETIFDLTELPRRLAVVGGGPLGCELAQAFSRLGSEVTLVQNSRLLPREDTEASELLASVFMRERICVLLKSRPVRVERSGNLKRILVRTQHGEQGVEADEILVCTGRRPNVGNLNLEKAGIVYNAQTGVVVNDFLQTTNQAVFAAGDVCMDWKYTHAADAAARIAVQNALFFGRKRLSTLTMPWCTYTDPEIAHIGLCAQEANARGIATDIYRVSFDEVDRAVADGETEGFVKIVVRKGTDRIIGATIATAHAGDLISEISIAMTEKIGLKKIANVIHPYPTKAEAIRSVAAAYNRTRLTPRISALLGRWLKWQRG